MFIATSVAAYLIPSDTVSLKSDLRKYGPLATFLQVDNDWYPAGSYRRTHTALIVGYHDATPQDDAQVQAAGGYWIIKNSWGTSWGDGGCGRVLYGNVERHHRVHAIDGAVYFTGSMATATWQGGGTWSPNSSAAWTAGGNAYVWENKETTAIFGPSDQDNPIAVSDTVIAHGLTFQSGAVGYAFSGGALTITAGGITADESVTINSAVTIGAPQTWSVAAGKVLTVTGNLHTAISDLTVAGAGDTVLSGNIDDGGTINSCGAQGGGLIMNGSGTLMLCGANSYTGNTTVVTGTLEIAAPNALPPGGSLTIGEGGTVVLRSGLGAGEGSATAAAVPEPSTLALVAVGAIRVLAFGWRRRKRGE